MANQLGAPRTGASAATAVVGVRTPDMGTRHLGIPPVGAAGARQLAFTGPGRGRHGERSGWHQHHGGRIIVASSTVMDSQRR